MPMSEMHSMALPRSIRSSLPEASTRICLSIGITDAKYLRRHPDVIVANCDAIYSESVAARSATRTD